MTSTAEGCRVWHLSYLSCFETRTHDLIKIHGCVCVCASAGIFSPGIIHHVLHLRWLLALLLRDGCYPIGQLVRLLSSRLWKGCALETIYSQARQLARRVAVRLGTTRAQNVLSDEINSPINSVMTYSPFCTNLSVCPSQPT